MGSQNELVHWCLKGNFDDQISYLESGCSGHMTGRKSMLSDFQPIVGPQVTFGDNGTSTTIGYGAFLHGIIKSSKFSYVNVFKHNLISISQLVMWIIKYFWINIKAPYIT